MEAKIKISSRAFADQKTIHLIENKHDPKLQGREQRDQILNKLYHFIGVSNYVGINHEMLIFQSRWSDHERAESGDGNPDNDPTRDYYLSRLILDSIRLLFCSNLIMDRLVFCPILVPGNKQFRKWRVCHWLPGIFVSILQIIRFTRAKNYCGAHFALASSVTPRQKETSKSVARSLRFVLLLPPYHQFWIRKRFVLSKLSRWLWFFQPPIATCNQI